MPLLIDNYDSFTYNLVQYLGMLGATPEVKRNDQTSVSDIITEKPDSIIISPGPAHPDQAGICIPLIQKAITHKIPVLGICLGHQAIGAALGGDVIRAPRPAHGEIASISHNQTGLFTGIPTPASFTRYHSLIIKRETCPDDLSVTAEYDGIIMAVAHKKSPVFGVQFHPESIASDQGLQLLENFLKLSKAYNDHD